MVNDQEPRYRLVDGNGNVVGTLFAEADGTLKLQEGTSGNDNELSFTTQGALEVEQLLVENQQSDLHWKHVKTLDLSGSGSTQAGTYTPDATQIKIIFNGRNSSNLNPLVLTTANAGTGDYEVVTHNSGTLSSNTSSNEFVLLNPSEFSSYGGEWKISKARGNRPAIFGCGEQGLSIGSTALFTGAANGGGEYTFEIANSTYNVADVEIFERATL